MKTKEDVYEAINKLTPDELKNPVIVLNRNRNFLSGTIYYLHKGKFYEAKNETVRLVIQCRSKGKPNETIVKNKENKLLSKYKNNILFNIYLSEYYGNWVLVADKMIKIKRIELEDFLFKL